MTEQEKLAKIDEVQNELREMYDNGDFGELLESGLPKDKVEFLIKLKDYYRAQDQKSIIAGKFVI
ncbi:MAG: hypothetical protein LBT80_04635 [Lactobacillaceae bacterium]|jgi:hypothetical protein|nr:hypothetical protein [Lactobacillaceae bacterium]